MVCGPLWPEAVIYNNVFKVYPCYCTHNPSVIVLFMYTRHSVCPFISWRSCGLLLLSGSGEQCSYEYSCAGFCGPVFLSLGYLSRCGIAMLYSSSRLNHLRNCWAVFQHGCTILHFPYGWMGVPIYSHPCQYLLLSISSITGILVSMKWRLPSFDLHFLGYSCTFVYLLWRNVCQFFAHFLSELFVFLLLSYKILYRF